MTQIVSISIVSVEHTSRNSVEFLRSVKSGRDGQQMATHRLRRGKLVEIPEKWRNRVPSNQTLLQRKAKARCVKLNRKKRVRLEQETHFEFNS